MALRLVTRSNKFWQQTLQTGNLTDNLVDRCSWEMEKSSEIEWKLEGKAFSTIISHFPLNISFNWNNFCSSSSNKSKVVIRFKLYSNIALICLIQIKYTLRQPYEFSIWHKTTFMTAEGAALGRVWGYMRLYDSYAVDFNYATRQWGKLNKHSVRRRCGRE